MKTTGETDQFLKSSTLEQFNQYLTGDYTSEYRDLADYLNRYIASHPNLSVPQIIKDSLLNRNYAYQILNGQRKNPSRNHLIPLCMAMHMDLDETNRALKIGKSGTLYSKEKRDALIILCIHQKQYDLMKVNELLYEHGFDLFLKD